MNNQADILVMLGYDAILSNTGQLVFLATITNILPLPVWVITDQFGLDEDHGRITIRLTIDYIPRGMGVNAFVVPQIIEVPSGEGRPMTIKIDWPIKIYDPERFVEVPLEIRGAEVEWVCLVGFFFTLKIFEDVQGLTNPWAVVVPKQKIMTSNIVRTFVPQTS